MRLNNLLRFFILFCISIAGCTNTNNTPAVIAFPTQTSIPITETPIPSTQTITPTFTQTAIPTLSVDDARKRLLDMLTNNGNCRLPCLWGITPGKSTSQEAQAILSSFSGISILTNFNLDGGSIAPWYTEGDLILSTSVGFNLGFRSDNQIVSYLTFKAGEYEETADSRSPIYDSKIFGERLHPYMLPGILSEFGRPESVAIHTYGKQIAGSGGFELLLLYPDQGIFVHYTTQMETVGTNARGCPANAQVELYLYPSGDADAFTQFLSETDWAAFVLIEPINDLHWKPIDKATSMSVEQFYETFHQPTDKCIETPLKGWYIPEQ